MKNKIFQLVLIVLFILLGNKLIDFGLNFYFIDNFSKSNNVKIVIITKLCLSLLTFALIYRYKFNPWYKLTWSKSIMISMMIFASYISIDYMQTLLITMNIHVSNIEIILFLLSTMLIGLFEELFFRVFVFNYLQKLGFDLIKSVMIAAIVFASAHLGNLFNSNFSLFSAIIQIIFAFGIGCIFHLFYIRTKSLFLVIFLHGILNFFGFYRSHFVNAKSTIEIESTYDISRFITSLIAVSILTLILTFITLRILRASMNKKDKLL